MRLNLEFLDAVDNRRGTDHTHEDLAVVESIQQEEIAAVALAVHRRESELANGVASPLATAAGILSRADRRYAGRQLQQLGEISPIQRQVIDLAGRNRRAQFSCGRFDVRRCGRHCNFLLRGAHVQRKVLRDRLVDRQGQGFCLRGIESLGVDCERVNPGDDARKHISPRVIGSGGPLHAGGRIGQHDSRRRNDGAAGIGNCAVDRSGGALAEGGW